MTQTSKPKRSPISVWTSHIREQEAKESFRKAVINSLNSDLVMKRLVQIIDKMQKECVIIVPEDSAWPYRRAYADGMIAAYARILNLLETPNE